MKYLKIDELNWKGFKIEVFEVVDKEYLMLRVWKGEILLDSFFSGRGSWIDRVEKTMRREGA